MSHSKVERRKSPRRPYFAALFVRTLDEPKVTFPCQTLEISAEGLRIVADRPLAVERPIQLWLRLANEPGTFLLHGQVRWCEPSNSSYSLGIAIETESGDGRDWKALLTPLAGTQLSLDLTLDAD